MFFYRFCFFRTIFKLVEMNKFVKENLLEIPDQGFMYEHVLPNLSDNLCEDEYLDLMATSARLKTKLEKNIRAAINDVDNLSDIEDFSIKVNYKKENKKSSAPCVSKLKQSDDLISKSPDVDLVQNKVIENKKPKRDNVEQTSDFKDKTMPLFGHLQKLSKLDNCPEFFRLPKSYLDM